MEGKRPESQMPLGLACQITYEALLNLHFNLTAPRRGKFHQWFSNKLTEIKRPEIHGLLWAPMRKYFERLEDFKSAFLVPPL